MAIIHDVLCLVGFLRSVMYDNKLHDVPNFLLPPRKIIIPTPSAQKEKAKKGDAEKGQVLFVYLSNRRRENVNGNYRLSSNTRLEKWYFDL